ncbi:Rha family transcriptional regulator [Pseudomonas sp. BP8]|uniref:Rha family transcriptional regulator n=1 Tax=Pseudomonas sp. BP8 TaxID=2817864 RepID=UPI001AEB683C|nr:Rha family transcriptional regulator [Pseudomonas sp. BP8]MBP2261274.1 phage antirepressor YoqD-like protein/phage regulator Rha-like protein [Pseudomonas sp. BP8]HDS1736260.1 Rha family transcriptional regulator [Pseudomonas putida]
MTQNISYNQAVTKHTTSSILAGNGGPIEVPAFSTTINGDDDTEHPVTMSSLEIAELTGKRHDNVARDIRTMLESLDLPHLSFEGGYKDLNNQERMCFNLPRDLTETLITGYSIPLRHKVVVRLRELETKAAKPPAFILPDFTNPVVAARAWATEFEGRTLALEIVKERDEKIAKDAPKVKVFNKFIASGGLYGFQEFCTQLSVNQRTIKLWLRDIKWLRVNRWERNPLPTAKAVDDGYCKVISEQNEYGFSQVIKFTEKAKAYVELKAPDHVRKKVDGSHSQAA